MKSLFLCLALSFTLWAQKTSSPKAWIGIAFKDLPLSSIPKELGHKMPEGAVQIEKVIPGASGEQAGLEPNDIILSVNGTPLNGRATLLQTIQSMEVGEIVELTLGRNGKIITKKMALSPRPEDIRSITNLMVGSPFTALKGSFYANSIDSEFLKGKTIILDFWATWCGPCKFTLPSLEKLYQNYKSKDVVIVGISSEPLSLLKQFQEKNPHSYPLFNDTSKLTHKDYSIMAFPTMVYIDKFGVIQKVVTGAQDYSTMESNLLEVLKI